MKGYPGLDRRVFLNTAFAALLLGVAFLIFKPFFGGRAESAPRQTDQGNSPKAVFQQKDVKDPAARNARLAELIDRAIDQSELANARWGVCVVSQKDGQLIYSRNADRLFTPASNMKVYTTGVALDLLGADYRWRTSVYANSPPDATGRIDGSLILYGRGAPDLTSESNKSSNSSLAQLADDLYRQGVRHIRGSIVGDESYFRGEDLGDGWQWTDIQWYFGAEPSALSINDNEIDVNILPPTKVGVSPVVNVSDSRGYVILQNQLTTVERGDRAKLGIQRGLSDNIVRVWGEFPLGSKGYGARLSVHHPALWAANLFAGLLRAHGITVDGGVNARDSRTPINERFDPAHATELAFVSSKSLNEIIRTTNKQSVNLNAELILRTLGRERAQMIPDPEPVGRERGDDENGIALIRLWLSRSGVSVENLALHDGSGLSRLDLVTPHATTGLLLALSKTASADVFRESLPIAGKDGTLAGRLPTLANEVWAKTGTLTYDNSLSGYLRVSDGETLVFSIMCNDQTRRTNSLRVIDEVVTAIADYSRPEAQN